MDKNRIRFGVIGCGQVAQLSHLPSIAALPQAELKAICDVRESVSKRVGEIFHVKHYVDYHKMIEEADLDAISICTPESSHVPVAVEILGKGINTLCEKPISNSITQAERLVQFEKKSKAKVMIAYMMRYDPGVKFVENMLTKKEIGKPYVANLTWFISDHIPLGGKSVFDRELENVCPNYATSKELISAPAEAESPPDVIPLYYILGYGCHLINLLRGLLGEVKEVVSAYIRERRDTFVTLSHVGGCVSNIVMTDGQRCDWKEQLQVQCDNGAVELEIPLLYKRGSARVKVHKNDGTFAPSLPYTYRYTEEYKDFIHRAQNGIAFKTDATDGLQDLKIIRKVIDMSQEKRVS
jgi:predicted dehydrogenase